MSNARTVHYKLPCHWRLLMPGSVVLLGLTLALPTLAQDVSVLQRATSSYPSSPHDNPLGYAVPIEDAYLATRPTPAWTLPSEHLEFLSYSPVGVTVYENVGLPRLQPWPLHQASAWAMLWSGAGVVAGTAMWTESGRLAAVTEAAIAGALVGAPLGFLLGSAESSFRGLSNGRLLPDNVRVTLTAVQLERASDPISRPDISYAILPAVVGEFY